MAGCVEIYQSRRNAERTRERKLEMTPQPQTPERRAIDFFNRIERFKTVQEHDEILTELTAIIKERDELKREAHLFATDPRNHFRACNNCKPVMCCNGQECGCQGMPTDFEVSEKCDDDCYAKVRAERDSLREKAAALDWLDANNAYIMLSSKGVNGMTQLKSHQDKTLLSAITLAMKEEKK
jgi:Myotubularin-like phosphatase domain